MPFYFIPSYFFPKALLLTDENASCYHITIENSTWLIVFALQYVVLPDQGKTKNTIPFKDNVCKKIMSELYCDGGVYNQASPGVKCLLVMSLWCFSISSRCGRLGRNYVFNQKQHGDFVEDISYYYIKMLYIIYIFVVFFFVCFVFKPGG